MPSNHAFIIKPTLDQPDGWICAPTVLLARQGPLSSGRKITLRTFVPGTTAIHSTLETHDERTATLHASAKLRSCFSRSRPPASVNAPPTNKSLSGDSVATTEAM